jgi:aryl sulfotransferase
MWQPEREYRSIIMDNLRWQRYVHRPGDIVVCTPAKNGTTWMQTIVTTLLFPDGAPGPVFAVAPWIDARFEPIDDVIDRLEAQTHRRHIKTHTAIDGIPWYEDNAYIVVGRDGRDSCMSFQNHLANMQPALLERLLVSAIEEGIPMDGGDDGPPPVHDTHAFFAWYLEHSGQFEHLAGYWARRDDPNVLFVHYNDMLADLDGSMRRVSAFLDLPIDEGRWARQVASCTFAGMKARAEEIADFESHFVGGADTFLYKGTNGRWQDVLTADELAAYDRAVAAQMPADCAAWLAGGAAALSV